ncbi:hypothetical protein CKA32_000875 [Geitlerinema sp. FC II]|nr:hypothetical protein CKA32_000875 [Geitlerinema sp. FC II]
MGRGSISSLAGFRRPCRGGSGGRETEFWENLGAIVLLFRFFV